MLGPLFEVLAQLNVAAENVVYADDAVDEVRSQLLGLDGVLVWVNPIQDGADRGQLDELLRDVSAKGVWVSAHPGVIARMGTKEVLFHTRSLGWGTETDLYYSPEELAERFPSRLGGDHRLVIKQARGNGGNGVWRVDLAEARSDADAGPSLAARVRVMHAQTREAPIQEMTLGHFLERICEYFAWSGSVVVQPYQSRLAEGMIRCYFVQDQVVGFCHRWPRGLLDPSAEQQLGGTPGQRGPMEDADAPAYQSLRSSAETQWVPGMQQLVGINTADLPVIWDADFLLGPKDDAGADSYVLCEINISAVWPYPTQASQRMTHAPWYPPPAPLPRGLRQRRGRVQSSGGRRCSRDRTRRQCARLGRSATSAAVVRP
jgi:hypothetical protein